MSQKTKSTVGFVDSPLSVSGFQRRQSFWSSRRAADGSRGVESAEKDWYPASVQSSEYCQVPVDSTGSETAVTAIPIASAEGVSSSSVTTLVMSVAAAFVIAVSAVIIWHHHY